MKLSKSFSNSIIQINFELSFLNILKQIDCILKFI